MSEAPSTGVGQVMIKMWRENRMKNVRKHHLDPSVKSHSKPRGDIQFRFSKTTGLIQALCSNLLNTVYHP